MITLQMALKNLLHFQEILIQLQNYLNEIKNYYCPLSPKRGVQLLEWQKLDSPMYGIADSNDILSSIIHFLKDFS